MKNLYKVPDQQHRKIALGSLADLPYSLKKSLQEVLPLSKPMSKPQPGQWLWSHQQQGQSFYTYSKSIHNVVDNKRNIIYIQPLEQMDEKFLLILSQYCQCFFYPMRIKLLKSNSLVNIPHRINEYTKKIQYHAKKILQNIQKQLPSDGFCILGICLQDLYPRQQWNFVFGLASIKNRVGVFSFARYDDRFYKQNKIKYQVNYDRILWPSISVMIHQITHMFGIKHCIYYQCVMNGSNHLEESKKRPLELCVVCLRKLQDNVGFDVKERYEKLYQFVIKYNDNSKKKLKEYLEIVIGKIQLDKVVSK